MGLLKKIADRVLGTNDSAAQNRKEKDALLRKCYFEVMEQRRVLSADPVVAGITYAEGDGGDDSTPDHFEVTFEGGADTTQMTQFTINGDQDSSGGLSDGDMFFDIGEGQPGTAGYHPFQFDAANSQGISEDDILGVSVSDDGLVMTVELANFEAGDKLAFTIDVDEVERFRTDKIASGVEYEGTFFNASFVDENYTFESLNITAEEPIEGGFIQSQQEGIFYDEYDNLLIAGETAANGDLDLAFDAERGNPNRSAGAIDAYELVAKPITISGSVHHDEDLDCERDAVEVGIEGVEITLQLLNESNGQYETVASTTTDADGNYEFGLDLNLKPGTYRLIEGQPEGYLDVGAVAGTVEGTGSGEVQSNSSGYKNIISNINIPLGGTAATDYDFCEVRPASISGHVWHDANDDGVFDPNEEGIANVLVQVTRVGAKDGVVNDPFAGFAPISVRTDANGHYSVDALPPGIYEVVEINNYPAGENPLAGFIDGKDSTGNIRGTTVGTKSNDAFRQIELCADDAGVEYNFGELKPASISGSVSVEGLGGGKVDPSSPDFEPISGVEIQLFDEAGNLLETTRTDFTGRYEFDDLAPGTYSIVEVQPTGFFDSGDIVGMVDGVVNGTNSSNDRFSNIVLGSGDQGVRYDFCELLPATLKGTVYHDVNDNGTRDAGEDGIGGVLIQLFDADGNLTAETRTDGNGEYCFEDIVPGIYKVREIQPTAFLDGKDSLGTVASADGTVTSSGTIEDDAFCDIVLNGGDTGTEYNFGEVLPASIKGTVYHDRNDNGVQDSGEEGISNVVIQLFDADGQFVADTLTDENGDYCFDNLAAGNYELREIQPSTYTDGKDVIGTVDGTPTGTASNDRMVNISLSGGDQGIDYDFGELRFGSIAGYVHTDNDGDCVYDANEGDRPLAGVTLELLNSNGDVIGTTVTGTDGSYNFENLIPGTYSVRQQQPDGYFTSGEVVGSGTGTASTNLLSGIRINSGQRVTQYNFCEQEAAEIHGRVWEDGPAFVTEDGTVPANYRDQRDGVYQEGVDTPIAGVRMQLYYYIDPTNQEIAPRAVTLGEVQAEFYGHMGTSDPNAEVWVETMDDGQYWFQGLQAGNYVVLEVQPDGFVDSNDTPGSTTGTAYNSSVAAATAPLTLTRVFSGDQIMDAVVNIRVNAGGLSVANNFSEVRAEREPDTPTNPPDPRNPDRPTNPQTPRPGLTGFPGLFGSRPSGFTQFVGTARGATFQTQAAADDPNTWHLSVIDGGLPRAVGEGGDGNGLFQQAGYLNSSDWNRFDMTSATWSFTQASENGEMIAVTDKSVVFGMPGGTPLAGDFDGDGTDEVAVYMEGYWMIDINRNGRWDDGDLLAKLGNEQDQPVVGDWDGDGKDDIGIFGPMWARDPEAIERDPGLPNPDNNPLTKPKNIPPTPNDATNGARVMKLTSYGTQRSDVVDHVFGIEDGEKVAVTGDWNGNGIRSIGTFEDGKWRLDVNGDGEFDHRDATARFGRAGDIPLVGDFDGDGVEQIAVYRSGTWIIDSNNNRELDATDKTFQMGGAADKPVVGDWNGDGLDETGLYSEMQRPVDL